MNIKINKMKTLLHIFFSLTFISFSTVIITAQPNAPSNPILVPRYDASISLVFSWNDNSNNETGFDIQRREVGGSYSNLTSVGANVTNFNDNTATSDKNWEYRVRATNGSGNSAWTSASNSMRPRRVWVVNDGSNDVLHSYGNPLLSVTGPGQFYFHNGVDISGSGKRVDAAMGGRVTAINGGAGGTMRMNVDLGGAGMYNDVYTHIAVDAALGLGDILAPGTDVGNIRNNFFNRATEADHIHWGTGRNNLALYTQNSRRDPNMQAPVVADANDDGKDFIIVPFDDNDHNEELEFAIGGVDFLVDAYDDMSATTAIKAGLFNIGYWIQSGVAGGENVRNGATPYRLIQFDYPLIGPSAPTAIENAVMYWNFTADLEGIDTWQSYFTWIPTNTSGTDGSTGNTDATQYWKTDARKGTGTRPNASDASKAREIQESKFPDGTHFVHIILNDLVNTTDAVRSVVVDNYRPYVKKVTVYAGARIVYQSQWVWDDGAAQLEVQPATFDASANFSALRTQDVTIEVEFSEPMSSAQITSVAPLGVTPTLTSTQPDHNKTIWKGVISNLDIADDGSDDGTHMITFNGRDLANNELLQINSRTDKGANHNNRNAAGNLVGTIGQDNIHGFKIGPLEGVIPVTAIFMKTSATDPISPTTAAKALEMQNALNAYYNEVGYNEISFVVNPVGWYQLSQPIASYYTTPQTPLIDLVQEALLEAEDDGNDMTDDTYVIVVTDDPTAREEWSTNGGWPYELDDLAAPRLFATGVMRLASTNTRLNNLMGRMIGMVDLFAYPEVTFVGRPFVGPWSIMSDKDLEVHPLAWEKWRMGWLDETGTATGKTLLREPKPHSSTPIVNKNFTIRPLDDSGNGVKMVAIELADRLNYTVEYRRQNNLDSDLNSAGVLITKTNDAIPQGEGPAIVQESPVTTNDLDDAPYNTNATTDQFTDVGAGVTIDVISMNNAQAQIRLNYDVPSTQNDVYVAHHNGRWKSDDIWVDAPDIGDNYAADPLTIINADEKPVIGKVNRIYGRIRNKGEADATNIEAELEIREPWGTGSTWRSLKVQNIPLLQGQNTNPSAYALIMAEWTPTAGEHSCVKLGTRTVPNDINSENNLTQQNINEFVTTSGSPFEPVISRFQVENTANERLPIIFRVDGMPEQWTYTLTPNRPVLNPGEIRVVQITIQPNDEAPHCTTEQITITPHVPRIDALKSLGAITLQVALKNRAGITSRTYVDCSNDKKRNRTDPATTNATTGFQTQIQSSRYCSVITQGCTDPALPNTQVAIVYTAPDGTTQVRYVNTDANGCFNDIITVPQGIELGVEVVLEEEDCREEARTPENVIVITPTPGIDDIISDKRFAFYYNFGPNYPKGDFDSIYDPGLSIGLGLMFSINDRFTVLGHYGFHQFYSNNAGNDNIQQFGVKLRTDVMNFSDKSLYAQLGGSYYNPSFTSNKTGIDATIGLEWPLSSKFSIDAGLTYHFINDLQDNDGNSRFFHIPFGVNWKF